MFKYLIGLLCFLWPIAGLANEPPPVPEGGLKPLYDTPCIDVETNQKGHCYVMRDLSGNTYVTFWQQGELQTIRQVTDDGYKTIWMRDTYSGV